MKPDEAREWLRGQRSHVNLIPGRTATPACYAAIEVADAASTLRALVVLLADQEGLLAVTPEEQAERDQARRRSGTWDG